MGVVVLLLRPVAEQRQQSIHIHEDFVPVTRADDLMVPAHRDQSRGDGPDMHIMDILHPVDLPDRRAVPAYRYALALPPARY